MFVPPQVLTRLTSTLAAAFAAETAAVWLLDRTSNGNGTGLGQPASLLLKAVAGHPGLVVLKGARLRIGASGLLGAAASSGANVSVADAYADPRFNRALDKASGCRSGSVLVAPVRWPHRSGPVLALVQLVNKQRQPNNAASTSGGPTIPFSPHDERLMDGILLHLSAALARLGHELALDAGGVQSAGECRVFYSLQPACR